MSTAPGVEEVLQIPAHLERDVTEEHIDGNGHMNIRHYYDLGNHALWNLWKQIGVDESYITARRMSLFNVEHHLRFMGEVRLGEQLSAHCRLLERTEKSAHTICYTLNRTRPALAYVFESVVVHVDLETRRNSPMPPDIAVGADRLIAQDALLTWDPFLNGSMGVRRSP